MIVLTLRATNDSNGNPRIAFILLDHRGDVVASFDKGYGDRSMVSDYMQTHYPKDRPVWGPELDVTPREYRECKQRATLQAKR